MRAAVCQVSELFADDANGSKTLSAVLVLWEFITEG